MKHLRTHACASVVRSVKGPPGHRVEDFGTRLERVKALRAASIPLRGAHGRDTLVGRVLFCTYAMPRCESRQGRDSRILRQR